VRATAGCGTFTRGGFPQPGGPAGSSLHPGKWPEVRSTTAEGPVTMVELTDQLGDGVINIEL